MKNFQCIVTFLILTCFFSCNEKADHSSEKKEIYVPISKENNIDYPDFGFMLSPEEYNGRVFRLSDDFPRKRPKQDQGVKQILSIDFKTNWEEYMSAVKAYIFKGNAHKDYENSFFFEDNKERKWYHVPWQHWGPHGREGFHGLTQEGPVDRKMLAQTQDSVSHAYAVGFYNDLGGYTIGKVWPSNVPNYSSLKKEGFPEGTVVGKLLFVPFTEKDVPYLVNPVSWDAYIYKYDLPNDNSKNTDTTRVRAKVNLIQMDIMVRDQRAIETGGWVFGTFVYQGNLGNENRWENLIPVGIQWGDDPTVRKSDYNPTPTKTIINSNLKETIINPSEELPPMHLGWNSRLNGPVDNAYSSCFSCHSTAQYPIISPILPFMKKGVEIPPKGTEAPDEWMRWFRNVQCGTPFDPQATSFDFSLQLVKSIQNYIEYASTTQKGLYYEEYWTDENKIRRNTLLK